MNVERRKLTPDEANALFDVVVARCGARDSIRDQWLAYTSREDPYKYGLEFRFMGVLGFGGKLLYDGHRPAHVTCYPEDRNPERDALIAATNHALAEIPHPFLRRDL